jgi:hypothetical protein
MAKHAEKIRQEQGGDKYSPVELNSDEYKEMVDNSKPEEYRNDFFFGSVNYFPMSGMGMY